MKQARPAALLICGLKLVRDKSVESQTKSSGITRFITSRNIGNHFSWRILVKYHTFAPSSKHGVQSDLVCGKTQFREGEFHTMIASTNNYTCNYISGVGRNWQTGCPSVRGVPFFSKGAPPLWPPYSTFFSECIDSKLPGEGLGNWHWRI